MHEMIMFLHRDSRSISDGILRVPLLLNDILKAEVCSN